MLDQFHLPINVPRVYHVAQSGPKNHKVSFRIGESSFTYVGEWRFEANQPINDHYPDKLKSLSESLSILCPVDVESLRPDNQEGLCQSHQYKVFYFPNNVDNLGRAILCGDHKQAVEMIGPDCEACDIFSKAWILSNQYKRRQVRTSHSQYTETHFVDKKLISTEEMLVATVNPMLLAVLTKQSTLAIELLKVCPMNKDAILQPFDLSLNQIAEKLKLKTLLEYLNPEPQEMLPSKIQRLKLVSGFKLK